MGCPKPKKTWIPGNGVTHTFSVAPFYAVYGTLGATGLFHGIYIYLKYMTYVYYIYIYRSIVLHLYMKNMYIYNYIDIYHM